MSIRNKVLSALRRQEDRDGPSHSIDAVRRLVTSATGTSQFYPFVRAHHIGGHKEYQARPELLSLLGLPEPYNGHKDWGHWNVSLWIGNDEGLYRTALDCLAYSSTVGRAASRFIEAIGHGSTPDGAEYTHERVLAALEGLE